MTRPTAANAETFRGQTDTWAAAVEDNVTAIYNLLVASIAAGEVPAEYDSGISGGYSEGDVVWHSSTYFLYIAMQDQAEGAVQAITNTSYWQVIAGDDKEEPYNALGTISTTTDLDADAYSWYTATIGAALEFTFSNAPAAGNGGGFILHLTNGGAYTILWPATVTWHTGTAPELQVSGEDFLVFLSDDNGTTWYGSRAWREA